MQKYQEPRNLSEEQQFSSASGEDFIDDDISYESTGLSSEEEFDRAAPKILIEHSIYDQVNCANIYALDNRTEEFMQANPEAIKITDKILLARVTNNYLWMFPVNVLPHKSDYLQSKYGNLTTIKITLNSHYSWIPSNQVEFDDILASLPVGFARYVRYGLGLKWEYRLIPNAISQIEGIKELWIDGCDQISLAPPIYTLGFKRFGQIRRAMDNIVRRYQSESLADRRLVAYNNLLHEVDSQAFPLREKNIKPNALYELIKLGGERSLRSRKDRQAVISLVKTEINEIAQADTTELLELKTSIEQVTLDQLVMKFENMLSKDLTEQKWQDFFKSNPFILSLAFAYPVFMVQDQAHVGGITFQGVGEKIADFLFAQHFTGNLALIEIKRPSTMLLSPNPYRESLFSPNKELSGAILQVLDQKFRLQTNFTQKAYEADLKDVHPFAIHCIVIVGTVPSEKAEKKSLDLFRNATKDVVIITFDELLGKLREIQRIMKGKPADNSLLCEVPF